MKERRTEQHLSGVSNILLVKSNRGFGMTSRIKEYLRNQGKTAVWMDLDSGCNEREIFIKRFSQQIWDVDEHKKYNRTKSLYEYNTGFSVYKSKNVSATDEVSKILEMIREMDKSNEVLIFNNVHIIWNQDVLSIIESLLKQNTECKILFLANDEPPFLAKYIISGQCKVIKEKQLFLKKREVVQKLVHKLGCKECLAEKLAEDLLLYFGGWPAGIEEMIRYMKEEEMTESDVDVSQLILESWLDKYVQYEIFRWIPAEELCFLRMLSMVPEYEEDLERELYLQSHCESTLADIHKKFFFLVQRKNSYTLIPAFQMILKNSITNSEVIDIIHMVTDYYFSKAEYEKANDYILRQKDIHIVEDYLERSYELLQKKGKTKLCRKCILFFIRRGKPLSGTMMYFAAEIFNADYDRRQKDKTKGEDLGVFQNERQFYMDLLSYNRLPVQYQERLQSYFEEVRNSNIHQKKVRVQSFGLFEVKVLQDGKALNWRTKKGCELFAFLYHMQGKPITREVLLNILWPDGIPKNGVTMLHNMIYNIRKELAPYGLEELILYKDKMYRLNMEWIESDYENQKELVEHAGEVKYLLAHEEAVQKYPGKYLGKVDGHWTIEIKEYYDRKYMECCMCLACEYMDRKDYGKALVFFKNILSVDELREDAVEKELYCLGKLGERKAVRQEYQRFEKLIRAELNVEPCENVKEMYEVVMKMR